jgi:general secretion pathway protein B
MKATLLALFVAGSALAQVPPQMTPHIAAPSASATGRPNFTAPVNPPPPPVVQRMPAPPAAPLPPVAGLPADAPKLVINGGIYSERRDVRAAIVNGQVVHEGADLGSGVVLEEIRPAGVVLGFRGGRYNIVY